MSANITNMKFSVFGRGYDDTRSDSGDGAVEDYNRYAMGASSAVFDSTGQYLWVGIFGNGHTAGLSKFDLEDDFNELAHGVPTGTVETLVLHAPNTNNNYGLAIQGNDWWVFDLTDDTVIQSGTNSTLGSRVSYSSVPYDCVIDGTKFYIKRIENQNVTTPTVIIFDYSDNSVTVNNISANRSGGAFITKDIIYLYYATIWFYQYRYIEGVTPSNVQVWNRLAPEGGLDGFKYMSLAGFGRKGRLYCPNNVYGSWRIGEYNGLRSPNFDTPKPIKVFGKFESEPTIKAFFHSHEQNYAIFRTPLGSYVTDYEDCFKISDLDDRVFAVSDKYAVVEMGRIDSGHINSIGIFKYR